jgi:hypothetical protein
MACRRCIAAVLDIVAIGVRHLCRAAVLATHGVGAVECSDIRRIQWRLRATVAGIRANERHQGHDRIRSVGGNRAANDCRAARPRCVFRSRWSGRMDQQSTTFDTERGSNPRRTSLTVGVITATILSCHASRVSWFVNQLSQQRAGCHASEANWNRVAVASGEPSRHHQSRGRA